MEKKTETPRTRNREWGFFGTCASNGHADPEAAWDEAMAALTDPKGPYFLDAEDARELLDATWGRHLADQVVGQANIRRAIRTLGWARDARNFVREHINPSIERLAPPMREEKIARLTQRIVGLDVNEQAFAEIEKALADAYEAGRKSARR